jgi:hypothetical protein
MQKLYTAFIGDTHEAQSLYPFKMSSETSIDICSVMDEVNLPKQTCLQLVGLFMTMPVSSLKKKRHGLGPQGKLYRPSDRRLLAK